MDEDQVDDPAKHPPRPPLRPESTAGAVLMAAMLGLSDGMGFERPKQETIEVVSEAPNEPDRLKLSFGDLSPPDHDPET